MPRYSFVHKSTLSTALALLHALLSWRKSRFPVGAPTLSESPRKSGFSWHACASEVRKAGHDHQLNTGEYVMCLLHQCDEPGLLYPMLSSWSPLFFSVKYFRQREHHGVYLTLWYGPLGLHVCGSMSVYIGNSIKSMLHIYFEMLWGPQEALSLVRYEIFINHMSPSVMFHR